MCICFAAVARATVSAEPAERVLGLKATTLQKRVLRRYVRRFGRPLYDLDDVRRWLLTDPARRTPSDCRRHGVHPRERFRPPG